MQEAKEFKHFFQMFEEKAGSTETENQPAISFDEQILTYRETNNYVNQLCHYLQNATLGITEAEPQIGLFFLHQSPEYIISMLAAMKIGIAFVPLSANPEIPTQRLVDYLKSCNIKMIITHSSLKNNLFLSTKAVQGIQIIFIDEIKSDLISFSIVNPNKSIPPKQLAYILNTSGSTGIPKAVLIECAGIYNCVNDHIKILGLGPGDYVAGNIDISFDANIIVVAMTLASGACFRVLPIENRTNWTKLKYFYNEPNREVTVSIFTPSMLDPLDPNDFPKLRALISTGEKVTQNIVNKWCPNKDTIRLFCNGYGPSEATIATSLAILKPGDEIHIGIPITGVRILVLEIDPPDPSAPKRVKQGQEGEMYIFSDAALARGYSDAALTKKAFLEIIDPDDANKKMRVFKSGDRATLLDEKINKIRVEGRVNRQIKFNGELYYPEETESVLLQNKEADNIEFAYVDARKDEFNHTTVTAYLLPHDKTKSIDLKVIYNRLVAKLKTIMVPSGWVVIDEIPLNVSKKVDVNFLRSLEKNIIRIQGTSGIQPRDDLEKQLAEIWKAVLGFDKEFVIYIDDDFRQLGGTSLGFAVLLQKLKQNYRSEQFNLSLDELIQSPTIATVARYIRRLQSLTPILNKPVLLNNSKNSSFEIPPMFVVHSLLGNASLDYKNLIEQWPMATQRAIYGLNARGLTDPLDMDDNLHVIARDYVRGIKEIQQQGPYIIAGWSAGGIILSAMAKLLGEDTVVIMIDSEAPSIYQKKSKTEYAAYLLDLFDKKLSGMLKLKSCGVSQQELEILSKEEQIHKFCQVIKEQIESSDTNKTKLEENLEIKVNYELGLITTVCNLLIGILNYKLNETLTNTMLIAAEETQKRSNCKDLGWDSFGVIFESTVALPGNHESIVLDSGKAKNLAKLLSDICIKRTQQIDTLKITKMLRNCPQPDMDEDELRYYIPVNGCWNNNYRQFFDLEKEASKFIEGKQKVCVIFGNAGSGKTWFFKYMTDKLAKRFKVNNGPIVLYIPLASFENSVTGLIEQRLKHDGLSDKEIKHLKENQDFVVFLDGYDEMRTSLYKNLFNTNEWNHWRIKVFISCRSSYLLNANNYRLYFVPVTNRGPDYKSLSEITMVPFSEEQIDSYIAKYLSNKKSEAEENVKKNIDDNSSGTDYVEEMWEMSEYKKHINTLPGVRELISTPFLLRLLMECLPNIASDYEKIPTKEQRALEVIDLYDYFVKGYFERQETKLLMRNALPLDGRDVKENFREYSEQLARTMWEMGVTQVSYRPSYRLFEKIENILDKFFSNTDENIVRAREGSPIRRLTSAPNDAAEHWAFLHFTLQEYFISTEMFHKNLQKDLEIVKASPTPLQKTEEDKTTYPFTMELFSQKKPEPLSEKVESKQPEEIDEDEELQLAMAISLSMSKH